VEVVVEVVVLIVVVVIVAVVIPRVVDVVPGTPLDVATAVGAGVVVEVEVEVGVAASPLEHDAAASAKRTMIARLLPAMFFSSGLGNGIPARLPAVQFQQGS
jgi:hypothetical protein